MADIVVVNPGVPPTAGMAREAAFVATCFAAAPGSSIMGLYAEYPGAFAPAIGLNAYFDFTVAQGMATRDSPRTARC